MVFTGFTRPIGVEEEPRPMGVPVKVHRVTTTSTFFLEELRASLKL
jgi:hypothetical protein